MMIPALALCLLGASPAPSSTVTQRKVLVLATPVEQTAESEHARLVPSLLQAELSRDPGLQVFTEGVLEDAAAPCATLECSLARLHKAGAQEAFQGWLNRDGTLVFLTVTRHAENGALLSTSTRPVPGDVAAGLVATVRQCVMDVTAPPPWAAALAARERPNWFADLSLRRLAMVVVGGGGLAVSFVAVCVAIAGMSIAGGAAVGNALQAYFLWRNPMTVTNPDGTKVSDGQQQAIYQISGIVSASSGCVGFGLLGIFAMGIGAASATVFGLAMRGWDAPPDTLEKAPERK